MLFFLYIYIYISKILNYSPVTQSVHHTSLEQHWISVAHSSP